MKTNLSPQNQIVTPIFDLRSLYPTVLKSLFTVILMFLSVFGWGQTSVQNFGTTAASNTSQTGNATTIPSPTSGTSYARAGTVVPNAPVAVSTTSNPLGTTGAFLKATASAGASVTKASPIISYTSGTEFYTSYKILLGDTNASNTATSGLWTYYIGNQGSDYTSNSDPTNPSTSTFAALRFTFGAFGALTLQYNNNGTYSTTGLTTSSFAQGTVYTIEVFGNNKTTGTISYLYNGVSQTVAVQKFDLYINGTLIGNDLTKGGMPANSTINAMTFTGVSSTSNVANIFVDDVTVYNAIPATVGVSSYSSKQDGLWSDINTWNFNGVPATVPPTSADNVVINSAHTVTTGAAVTRNATTTTVVDGTLVASVGTYTNNGTTTINGTFQINAGGYATGSDFVYHATTSTLIFNHSDNSTYGPIDVNHKYWPSAGPTNVIVKANSPINLGVARTVAGTFESLATVTNPGNITIGTNGILKLSAGYGWAGTGSPVYGTASLLQYNSAGSPGRGAEWTQSTGTVGTTAGLPQNVQISNNTTLNFPNGSGGAFRANGNLTIDSGSSLYQNYSGGSAALVVGGNLVLNGSLGLGSSAGGDITVGGNWTQAAAATFQPNGRVAIFNGTANQIIQKTAGGIIDFDKIEINKTNATTVSISNLVGNLTDVNINGTSGNVFALVGVGTGTIDLKGRALSFNNDGGFIYVDAAKSLSTTVITGATVNFNGSKTVANNGGAGSLLFPVNVTINLNTNGVLDFGLSASSISTVNGILNVNSVTNCFVKNNAPVYGTTSKLIYKSGGIYGRNFEWSTTSLAGYPYEVQVTNNTTLDYPNKAAAAFNTNIGVAANLTIDSGSSLYMDYGGGSNKSGSLTIGGNIINSGNLSLGNAIGGDLYLAGNWTNSGTFTPNSRAVIFNGSNGLDQTLTGTTTFDFLTVNKTSTGSVALAANIIVNRDLTLTNKNIVLGNFNLTLPNKPSVISSSANSYITTLSGTTGKLIRQNIDGTADWIFPMGVVATGRYTPIIFKNLSGTTEIGVRVSTTLSPAVADATRVLKTEWFATTTNNITANIYTEWQTAELGTNMTAALPTTGDFGIALGTAPYTLYDVNLVINNTQASGVTLSNTATNGIVIGLDNAIKIANDDCAGATNVIVDAVAISGTSLGATNSLPPVTCGSFTSSVSNDVWYKFTTSDAGQYKIDVILGSISDAVLELRSGACNGTYVACSDTGSDETITISLDANTTYYYRVYRFGTGGGTFTTSVTTIPTLIVNPTSLAFGDVPFNTDSANQTFTVKGTLLNPASGNISLSAPTGYQISLDGSTGWSATLSLPYTTKTLAQTTIYTKLNPASACTDYNGSIAISGGGAIIVNVALTGKGIIIAPIASIGTDITDTSFTANWNVVTGASGYELEVITASTPNVSVIGWNFPNDPDNNTADEGVAVNLIKTLTTNATGTISYTPITVPLGTTSAASLSGWDSGNGTKFWQVNFNTIGFKNLKLSSLQRGSNTGPKDFKLQYSLDNNSWNDVVGATVTVANDWTTGKLTDIVLPAACENNLSVFIRWIMTSNTSINNGTVAGTGTSAIDNIRIVGDQETFVTGYAPKIISGGSTISSLVTGLEADTQYYYRVRAVSGACKSANSNVISVLTDNKVTWNGTAWSNITGPTANLEAIIKGPFVTGSAPQNDFTAKKLTIATGGSVQITAGRYIKVVNELNNTLDESKFVVESDGNFWQTTSATNTGSITVKREITRKDGNQYNYLISPTVGSNLKTDIYGTGNSSQFTLYHNEANNIFSNSSGAYIKGRGLAVKEPITGSGTVTALFKGVPMNEAFTYNLANSNVGTGTTLGYNLTGNPYPSNIDLDKLYNLGSNKANISPTFYFWDNTVNAATSQGGTGYSGAAYALFNAAAGSAGTGTAAGSLSGSVNGNKIPTRVVKTGQAFMVQSIEKVNKVLDFDNSIRTADAGVGFFGNASKGTVTASADDRFWLNLAAPSSISTQIAVVYFDGGVDAFAKDDSKLNGLPSDVLYSVIGDQKAVINGRASFVNTDSIPLGSNSFTAGTFTFSLGNKEGKFANGQNIYLKDKQTGIVTNLSVGNYTFQANAGESTGRFEIIYQPETVLATDTKVKENLIVYKDGNDFVVKAQNKKISSLEVFDSAGRLIWALKPESIKAIIPAEKINNGLYVLKINQNGEITSKKIIR